MDHGPSWWVRAAHTGVLACLQRDRLQVGAILVTHQHPQHGAGPAALPTATLATRERIPGPFRAVRRHRGPGWHHAPAQHRCAVRTNPHGRA